ncbi:MAG: hypothetical protein F4139_00615 [Gemmatimonadetes bacterium]|nr:hypothetical protein [Gemmatimonadota bacterium]MYH51431.1 hypothetical protein [Gemmatimonadota bacterium]MYK67479.1 hypothetical protein [Gemmatimonadota bacterium]
MNRSLSLFAFVVIASCDEPRQEVLLEEDLALALAADTVFIVGESPVDSMLTQVNSLGFDQLGNLHLYDSEQARLTTWNSEGRFVREVGRRGEGPGEFRLPRHSYAFPDGRVMVLDIAVPGLWVFNPDGRYTGTVRLSTGGGRPVPGQQSVLAGDRLVGVDDYWMSRRQDREDNKGVPLFTYAFAADSIESAPYYTAWGPPPSQSGLTMLPRVRIAGFSDGRVAVADSVGYRIKVLSRDGEVANVVERAIKPFPLTEIAMEAERERRRGGTSARQVRNAVKDIETLLGVSIPDVNPEKVNEEFLAGVENLSFASEVPVVRGIGVDWAGRMWITRSDVTGADGPIDLMEADGRYVGTLFNSQRPDAFGPGGLVAYIIEHELGTHAVVVARVTSITTSDRRESK